MNIDHLLVLNETNEGGFGDSGSTGDTGASAPDNTASTPAADTDTSSGWSADDPAFQSAVDERSASIAEAKFQQLLAGLANDDNSDYEYEQPLDFELDPFSDDYGQQLAQLIAQSQQSTMQQIQQLLSPLLSQHEAAADAEGQQRIKDIIADITNREGDLTNEGKGAVESIAPLFLEQFENTYGPGARAAEMALGQAAKVIRSIETSAATKAVERYKNELSTIGGARGVPAGGASGVEGGPRPTSIIDAGRRFAERHAAGTV